MEQNCVLLDTSFFIRLLNEEDDLDAPPKTTSSIAIPPKT